jgi:hypothetical protein
LLSYHDFPASEKGFSVGIIAIDQGAIGSTITTKVRASAKLVDLQHHIYEALQAEMFLGENLQSSLYILPMQNMTRDDLENQDLTLLRESAMPSHRLTGAIVSEYFGAQDSHKIHFLVWLPPVKGESFGRIYPIPTGPYCLRAVHSKTRLKSVDGATVYERTWLSRRDPIFTG